MERFLFGLLIVALVAGCGGEKETDTGIPAGEACGCGCGEEDDGASEWSPDLATATVRGVVRWEGAPPRRRSIDMGADKYCVKCHPEGAQSETAVVGPDGGFANVFVRVTGGLGNWKFPAPEGAVTLDQVGCTYVPHVAGIRVGQALEIRNSDATMHNVHAVDFKTKRDHFNFAQSKKGAVDRKSFRRPGLVYVKCDVHGWMSSYIHVVKHPFFAVTGEDGAFALPKLPPGTYTIEVWHEKYGTQTQSVTVADGATVQVDFTFTKA